LWRWDSNKRRIAVTLSSPFGLNPRLRFSLLTDVREERWDLRSSYRSFAGPIADLKLRKYEAGGEFAVGLGAGTQWTSGLSVARRSFRDSDGAAPFRDTWSFEWPNRLSALLWSWPDHRINIDGDLLLSPGRLISAQAGRFLISQGNLRVSWYPQASGDDLSARSAVSTGRIFGAATLDQFFMLGMERDNPLWIRGHAGTRGGRKGEAPMGTEYILIQNELSRTVFRLPFLKVSAGPFYDTGNMTEADGRFGSRGWMHDAGLSVTLKTFSVLAWTLVYGRNLRDGGGVFYAAASRTLGSASR
jgi:hypothetical protein